MASELEGTPTIAVELLNQFLRVFRCIGWNIMPDLHRHRSAESPPGYSATRKPYNAGGSLEYVIPHPSNAQAFRAPHSWNRRIAAPSCAGTADALQGQHRARPLSSSRVEYYTQRANKPGTLLITEATFIAARAGGYSHIPGIWSAEQIAAWKVITKSVHAKGSFIFMQLWALGRAASPQHLTTEDPSFPYVSASDVQLTGQDQPPRPLTVPEIKEYAGLYAQAAKNAIDAGCDGVEIHSANGYLLDQFLQDVSNKRTDEYGGSIENRARFVLEVVDAVVAAIGAEKTAIRFSPWSPFQDMGMADPLPTFSYVIAQLAARYPDLAYIHLVEPRINGNATRDEVGVHETNDTLRALWAPRPVIRAGGFTREGAIEAAESGDLIAFGRLYISNPDLPERLEKNIPRTAYERSTFYIIGEDSPRGYTDHAFAE